METIKIPFKQVDLEEIVEDSVNPMEIMVVLVVTEGVIIAVVIAAMVDQMVSKSRINS